ncbi:MAG: hypothetical protein AB2A00_05345 [Myxococcota bacterium]
MTDRSSQGKSRLRDLADKVQDALQALVDVLSPTPLRPVRVPVAVPARRRSR